MHQVDVHTQLHHDWRLAREKLLEMFGDDKDALALAELIVLRGLVVNKLAAHTIKNLRSPRVHAHKKLTR